VQGMQRLDGLYAPLSSADASGRESTTSGHYRQSPMGLESPFASGTVDEVRATLPSACLQRPSAMPWSPGFVSRRAVCQTDFGTPALGSPPTPAHGRHNPLGVHSDPGSEVSGRGRLLDKRLWGPISLRISAFHVAESASRGG
jgi:hypothetical protein